MTARLSRWLRSAGSLAAVSLALWLGGAAAADGQSVNSVAERFQASWGRQDVGALEAMMGPAVGLDVEGESHLGVPPRQAAATLDRLFDRYAPATPELVRERRQEGDGEGGFAEFRWRPLTGNTAEVVPYVIFVVFRPVASELRIAELRILR